MAVGTGLGGFYRADIRNSLSNEMLWQEGLVACLLGFLELIRVCGNSIVHVFVLVLWTGTFGCATVVEACEHALMF